jgi:hypothetical protein
MKKLALGIALVLLATVSASAAEISTAAPATPALEQLTPGMPPLFKGIKQLVPYCSTPPGHLVSYRGSHHGLHRRLQ